MKEEIILKNVRNEDTSRLIQRINASSNFKTARMGENLRYVLLKDAPCPPEASIGRTYWGKNKEFSEPCFGDFMPQAYLGIIRKNGAGLISYSDDDPRTKQLEKYMPVFRKLVETCWCGY